MNEAAAPLGAEVEGDGRTTVDSTHIANFEAHELVKTIARLRLVAGPAGSRTLRTGARVAARRLRHPARGPIDQHLQGLGSPGARIELEHGLVQPQGKRLRGATIVFDWSR